MNEKVVNLNVDMDAKCPQCGKVGSVNGGLCMSCVAKSLKSGATDIVDVFTIHSITKAVETQLIENAEQANRIWGTGKVDKIKLLSVSVVIKRDKDGIPGIKIDFGYGQKVGADMQIRQKALPGM